jgi:hypothetical protein
MEIRKGTCHCGAVVFQVELMNGFENLMRCNCVPAKGRRDGERSG